MISHAGTDQGIGPGFAAAKAAAVEADERVSAVLDCADFHHWEQEVNGSRVAYFKLRKPIVGAPAGTLLSLRELHALLFPAKR